MDNYTKKMHFYFFQIQIMKWLLINIFVKKKEFAMDNKIKKTNTTSTHISEYEKFMENIGNLKDRIKHKILGEEVNEISYEESCDLIIDDAKSLAEYIQTEMNGNLAGIITSNHSNLFLECCLRSRSLEGIRYLIKRGAEINSTNLPGNNALHMIILNEIMENDNKEKATKLLIDKGIDINRPNLNCETPLTMALMNLEYGVANILLDNGAYVLHLPASRNSDT